MDLMQLLPLIFSVLGSGLITWLFASVPLIKQIVSALPKPALETIIKAKDPGATIAWSSSAVLERRAAITAERTTLLAAVSSGTYPLKDAEIKVAALNREEALLPDGGILQWFKEHPMILVAVGAVIFLVVSGGKGCNKTPTTPPKANATEVRPPEVTFANPLNGFPLALVQ